MANAQPNPERDEHIKLDKQRDMAKELIDEIFDRHKSETSRAFMAMDAERKAKAAHQKTTMNLNHARTTNADLEQSNLELRSKITDRDYDLKEAAERDLVSSKHLDQILRDCDLLNEHVSSLSTKVIHLHDERNKVQLQVKDAQTQVRLRQMEVDSLTTQLKKAHQDISAKDNEIAILRTDIESEKHRQQTNEKAEQILRNMFPMFKDFFGMSFNPSSNGSAYTSRSPSTMVSSPLPNFGSGSGTGSSDPSGTGHLLHISGTGPADEGSIPGPADTGTGPADEGTGTGPADTGTGLAPTPYLVTDDDGDIWTRYTDTTLVRFKVSGGETLNAVVMATKIPPNSDFFENDTSIEQVGVVRCQYTQDPNDWVRPSSKLAIHLKYLLNPKLTMLSTSHRSISTHTKSTHSPKPKLTILSTSHRSISTNTKSTHSPKPTEFGYTQEATNTNIKTYSTTTSTFLPKISPPSHPASQAPTSIKAMSKVPLYGTTKMMPTSTVRVSGSMTASIGTSAQFPSTKHSTQTLTVAHPSPTMIGHMTLSFGPARKPPPALSLSFTSSQWPQTTATTTTTKTTRPQPVVPPHARAPLSPTPRLAPRAAPGHKLFSPKLHTPNVEPCPGPPPLPLKNAHSPLTTKKPVLRREGQPGRRNKITS